MTRLVSAVALIAATMLSFTGCSDANDTAKETVYVNLSEESGNYTVTTGGTYDFSGELKNGKIKVEASEDVTLILSGAHISNSDDEAIKIENTGKTIIKTANGTDNILTGAGDAAINSKSELELGGSGNLTIHGTEKHGIESDGSITISGGSITVNSYEHGIKSENVITINDGNIEINAETGKGIKAEKEYLGNGGSIVINSPQNEGLESKGALTINDGNYDITAGDDGINAGTSDSTATDETAEGSLDVAMPEMPQDFSGERPDMPQRPDAIPEGGEGTGAVPPEGAQPDRFRPEEIIPTDGEGEPTNTDENSSMDNTNPDMPVPPEGEFIPEDGKNVPTQRGQRPVIDEEISGEVYEIPEGVTTSGSGIPFSHERQRPGGMGGFPGINEDSVIKINGGSIKIKTDCDGIDSNGSLTISGGTVIIDGPEDSGNGPLDSDGEMIIENATLLTCSSEGMTQMPRSMTQGILSVRFENSLTEGDIITVMNADGRIVCEHTAAKNSRLLIYTSPEVKIGETYTTYLNGVEHSSVTTQESFGGGFGEPGGKNRPGRGGMDIPVEDKNAPAEVEVTQTENAQ